MIRIGGRTHRLWRAVDADGEALDILVQPRRDTAAAKRFLRKLIRRKLIRRWGRPRAIVTDKLVSHANPMGSSSLALSTAGVRGIA